MKRNLNKPPVSKIEKHGNKYCPVLTRATGATSTNPCFFCGKKHVHGIPDGHRVAHCNPNDAPVLSFVWYKKHKLLQEDGYILKTLK